MKFLSIRYIASGIFVIAFTFWLALILIPSPYDSWLENKISLQNLSACPPDWTFEDLSQFEDIPFNGPGEYRNLLNVLLPQYDKDMEKARRSGMAMEGGTNWIFNYVTGGIFVHDNHKAKIGVLGPPVPIGAWLIFKNSQPNKIFVLASGLAHSPDAFVRISADDGKQDTVYLDGCLDWSFPQELGEDNLTDEFPEERSFGTPSGFMPTVAPRRWLLTAKDRNGHTRRVEVERGVSLKVLPRYRVGLWATLANMTNNKNQLKELVSIETQDADTDVQQNFSSQEEGVATIINDSEAVPKDDGVVNATTRIMAWGRNQHDRLGLGAKWGVVTIPTWATEAERALEGGHEVLQIDLSMDIGCLLRDDKTVWCWGAGDRAVNPSPAKQIIGLPPVTKIRMGERINTCVETENDGVWCWREFGEVVRPVSLKKLKVPKGFTIEFEDLQSSLKSVYPSTLNMCATTQAGALWCWGAKYSYNGDSRKPLFDDWEPVKIPLRGEVADVDISHDGACAIMSDGVVYCWSHSQVPLVKRFTESDAKYKQVRVNTSRSVCALKDDGTVWCKKSYLDEGLPKRGVLQVEIQDGEALTGIVKLSGTACALRQDQTAWCWSLGQLSKKLLAEPLVAMNGVCSASNIVDISGQFANLAILKGDAQSLRRLSNPDMSDQILSAMQYDAERAKELMKEAPCLKAQGELGEKALLHAAWMGDIELLKILIKADVDLEIPSDPDKSALNVVINRASMDGKINPELVRVLVDAGADVRGENLKIHKPLYFMFHQTGSNLANDDFEAAMQIMLDQIRKTETIHRHPPNDLHLQSLSVNEDGCESGQAVFDRAGDYDVEIPAGCSTALAKVWGAGGGAEYGGTGGFSAGILDLADKDEVKVIVGGAGEEGKPGKPGKGGYNGGGDAGAVEGQIKGGNGGGGRSEILLDDIPAIIAGGGGRRDFPGGGKDADAFFKEKTASEYSRKGRSGSDGVGGKGGDPKYSNSEMCASSEDGGVKKGGSGASSAFANCNFMSGGGGGAGYGGGGGGGVGMAGGYGGGGLAPEHGITLWGGKYRPANSNDPDYVKYRGRANEDGLVVISWPAPKPEDLMSKLKEILPVQIEQDIAARQKAIDDNANINKAEIVKSSETVSENENEAEKKCRIDVPKAFTVRMSHPIIRTRYLTDLETLFRSNSAGNVFIDRQVALIAEERAVHNAKKAQRLRILQMDEDFDGRVTILEAKAQIKPQGNELFRISGEEVLKREMALDSNGDGVIDEQEMLNLGEEQERIIRERIRQGLKPYLDLIEESDGQISLQDFLQQAEQFFNEVDKDGDGQLSREELKCVGHITSEGMPWRHPHY